MGENKMKKRSNIRKILVMMLVMTTVLTLVLGSTASAVTIKKVKKQVTLKVYVDGEVKHSWTGTEGTTSYFLILQHFNNLVQEYIDDGHDAYIEQTYPGNENSSNQQQTHSETILV